MSERKQRIPDIIANRAMWAPVDEAKGAIDGPTSEAVTVAFPQQATNVMYPILKNAIEDATDL